MSYDFEQEQIGSVGIISYRGNAMFFSFYYQNRDTLDEIGMYNCDSI